MRLFVTSKRLLFGLVIALLFLGLYDRYRAYERVLRRERNNFSIESIAHTEKNTLTQPLRMNVEEANEVLKQPFYYLAKGKQCVAFASQDGRYVLKFLKQSQSRKERKIERAKRLEKSFEIAITKAADECGILFAHMSSTKGIHPNVTLLDSRGHLVSVPLNDVQFVIQEKVQFIKPRLISFMYEGKEAEAKQTIDALFQVLVALGKKGIEDNDGALIRNNNVGFLENHAIILDPGKFVLFKKALTAQEFEHSLRRLQPLENWLEKHYPTLAHHFEEARTHALISFD